jgi:tRNA(Arg) A34 adenosine deaminase TadA
MCSGTAYWANIGRIVFGASNEQLLELTGMGNPLNMTLNGSCRGVLGEGQKDVEVIGPVERLDSKIMEDSDWFWRKNRSDGD